MKVSIITATLDSALSVSTTIESVRAQTHQDIEHIFVDGGSSDNTLDIICSSGVCANNIIKQEGRGIYNALNLGLRKASGEVVGFLHSDDFFPSDDCLESIVAGFDADTHAVYGDLNFVSRQDSEVIERKWVRSEFDRRQLRWGWLMPHPTLYVRAELIRALEFDEAYNISGDYDFMLRLLNKTQIKVSYVPMPLVHMRLGGASNGSLGKLIGRIREDLRAVRTNGVGGMVTVASKMLRKLPQLIIN